MTIAAEQVQAEPYAEFQRNGLALLAERTNGELST